MPTTAARQDRRPAEALLAARPRTADELHALTRTLLGLDVPRVAVLPGSDPPFTYLTHAYFADHARGVAGSAGGGMDVAAGSDAVVWASRGGGKTTLGAAATLLDLLFKPGIQVRVLGGSLEQSLKMHEALRAMVERPALRPLLAGEPTRRRIELVNGSRVEVLAQSQRSVRGVRVQKLRCDEVEHFDPAIWQAAQMVTRSARCGPAYVRGSLEAVSTFHRPGGLMASLVSSPGLRDSSSRPRTSDSKLEASNARLIRWTALDVAERCAADRPCEGCVLWRDCAGRAKHATGFVPIDDLVAQWRRTSDAVWDAEMMCRRPTVSDRVYERFDVSRHVRETLEGAALPAGASRREPAWVAGMDFGLRSPTVVLWACVYGTGEAAVVHVIDEHAAADLTVDQHVEAMRQKPWPRPAWIGVDPAGHARDAHSGLSTCQLLRSAGYTVRSRPSRIEDGVERVRRRLDRDTLRVHPRCRRLIADLQAYHFDPGRPHRDEPVKDGPDHACDALRYLIVNLEVGGAVRRRSYW